MQIQFQILILFQMSFGTSKISTNEVREDSRRLVKDIEEMNKYEAFEQEEYSPGFAGRCAQSLCIFKHKLFNQHTFRPYYFSQFSEKCSCFTSGQRADISGSWYIFSSSAGKGQHGRSRRVTKARELRRASGRKQLTDKFVCLPENDGRILPA